MARRPRLQARKLARAHHRLILDLDRARVVTIELLDDNRDHGLDRTRLLEIDHNLRRANGRALDVARSGIHAKKSGLANSLSSAIDSCHNLTAILIGKESPPSVSVWAHSLDDALVESRLAVIQLTRSLGGSVPEFSNQPDGKSIGSPPGRVVRALTVTACRLLPATDRTRYAEEFYSELFELSRRHRLGHALRILRSAPAIRTGLRATPVAERGES